MNDSGPEVYGHAPDTYAPRGLVVLGVAVIDVAGGEPGPVFVDGGRGEVGCAVGSGALVVFLAGEAGQVSCCGGVSLDLLGDGLYHQRLRQFTGIPKL